MDPMDIDDSRPISSNAKGMYDFGDETGADAAETVDTRALSVRIGDKNWKTRLQAYEDLKRECSSAMDGDSSPFDEYASWIPKITGDANAGALDAGVDAAIVFADRCPSGTLSSYYDKIFVNVVDKAFAGKPATLLKGKALLMKIMEADEPTSCALYLISRLGDKKPKVPPTCLEVIKEGIIAYGAKCFPIKDILASLGPTLNGSNAPAREQALAVMVELSRWIGKAPFHSLLESLRPAQKSEFEKLVADLEAQGLPAPIPTVYLRKSRPKPGSAPVASEATASASVIDGRDFVEEVDLPKRLKSTEFYALIADEKWSEQLKGLQVLIDILGPTPKIKAGGSETVVGDIIAALKGFLRQGHIQVQTNSIKIFTLLADGLRGEFSAQVRPQVSLILSKCKEKKLTTEVQACLLMITKHCLSSLEILMEDLQDLIKNKKHPTHARIVAMDYIAAVASPSGLPTAILNDHLKPLTEALISVCEDPDPKVREACAATLAVIASVIKARGKVAVEAHRLIAGLETSAPRVYKKIQSMSDGGGDSAPAATTSAAPASATTAPKAVASSTAKAASTTTTASKRPSTAPGAGSAAAKKSSASSAGSGGGASKAAAAVNTNEGDDVDDLAMSPDEAEAALGELGIDGWDSCFQANMASAKWQDKVDALTALSAALVQTRLGAKLSAATVTYLSSKTGNFKISNISVLKAVIQVSVDLASSSIGSGDKFSRPAAWELLKHFGDKLSDKKTSDAVSSLLTALGEVVSIAFVTKRMKVVLDKVKAPTAHQAYLEWLKQAIQEFGAGAFPVQFISAFCQSEMDNKVAAIRTAAVEVIGQLFHQIGPRFQSIAFTDDMKPQIKSLLEAEFEKVTYDPSAASRATRGPLAGGGGSSAAEGKASSASSAGMGLDIPRNDLASVLDKNILSELTMLEGKTSWQNRKAALEIIIGVCEKSGHYLDCSGKNTTEIIKAIKARLNDTQANLKPIAASAIGHIISSVEVDSAVKILRIVAAGMLGGLQDNKKGMRDSTIQALTVCVTLGRDKGSAEGSTPAAAPSQAEPALMAALISPAVEALANTVGRQELLQFLQSHIENIKADCSELAPVLVLCMQDKTAAVRTIAEQLLLGLASKGNVTKGAIEKATRDLPTAVKRTLQASIDRMLLAVSGAGRPATAPATASVSAQPAATTAAAATTASSSAPTVTFDRAQSHRDVAAAAPARGLDRAQSSTAVGSMDRLPSGDDYSVMSTGSNGRWFLKKTNKLKRLEEFYRLNWPVPPEDVGDTEFSMLRKEWEPLLTSDIAAVLFGPSSLTGAAKNQDAFMSAMTELTAQLETPHIMGHTDLILRYCAYILCIRETSTGLLKLLQLIYDIFGLFHKASQSFGLNPSNQVAAVAAGVAMHDSEINIILPHLIDRCGHKSDRHKQAYKSLLCQASLVVIPNTKYISLMIQGLTSSGKNKKSRVVCIEEIQRILEDQQATSSNMTNLSSILSKNHLKEIGVFMEAKDTDMLGKQACLELCYALYWSVGQDVPKLIKLLGGGNDAGTNGGLAERTVSMIEERIKQKLKAGGIVPPGPISAAPISPARRGSAAVTSPVAASAVAALADDAMDISMYENSGDGRNDAMEIDYEDGNAPFKLDITPPKLSAPSNINRSAPIPDSLQFKLDKTPAKPSSPAAASNNPQATANMAMVAVYGVDGADLLSTIDFNLTGVQLEIANKMDAYLQRVYYTGLNESPIDADRLKLRESALDYIKILHEMAVGQWYKPSNGDSDVQIPLAEAEALIIRLGRCIACGFEYPTPNRLHQDLSLDVNLLSVAMATLFQLLKRSFTSAQAKVTMSHAANGGYPSTGSAVVKGLSLYTVRLILKVCLGKLVDDRLVKGSVDLSEESYRMSCNITKGLNMIALRLAEDANNGIAIRAMVHILLDCALSEQALAIGNPLPITVSISSSASQPCSRLLLHVLSDEVSKQNPFSMPNFDLKGVLKDLHDFYIKHPLLHVENERPFRCAKTILNEIVKCIGAPVTLSMLRELDIPNSSFISKLTGKLGNTSTPDISPELNSKVVAIIDEITSARDKMIPIKQLHEMKKLHPDLDIPSYLNRISSAFRRFVLDTLNKLDAEGDENEPATQQSTNTQRVLERMNSNPNPRANTADEALRILEGLKVATRGSSTRQSITMPNSANATPAQQRGIAQMASPRAQISDKVMGSLANLTAALEMVPAVSTTSAKPILERTVSQDQPNDDSDLSTRVSRLVSHFNKP